MTIGTLTVRIEFHDRDRIHYGSDDAVSGNVVLSHSRTVSSTTTDELFGPLQISVRLKGSLRVTDARGRSVSLAQHTVLVDKMSTIYDGTYRAKPDSEQRFPFAVSFPEYAQPKGPAPTSVSAVQDANGQWQFRSEFLPETAEPLPPTLGTEDEVACGIQVDYRVGARAQLPGIDIVILNTLAERTARYEIPRVPRDAAITLAGATKSFDQVLTVHSKELVPDALRPHGFADKTKALLRSTDAPTYSFTLTCSGISTHLFVGQSVGFSVAVARLLEQTSSTVEPEISLSKCRVTLLARTTSKAPPDTLHRLKDTDSVVTVRAKDAEIVPPGPFHKGHEYSKNVNLGVLSHVPSTFTSADVSRNYKLRIQMEFTAASEVLYVSRQFDVVVYPPLHDSTANESVPYDLPPPLETEDEALPSYGEVVAAGPSNSRFIQ